MDIGINTKYHLMIKEYLTNEYEKIEKQLSDLNLKLKEDK